MITTNCGGPRTFTASRAGGRRVSTKEEWNTMNEIESLKEHFPIVAQNTVMDRIALLKIRDILRARGKYTYLEVGSFMGGTLAPFLNDKKSDVGRLPRTNS